MRNGKKRGVRLCVLLWTLVICLECVKLTGYADQVPAGTLETQTESFADATQVSQSGSSNDLGITDEELEHAFSEDSTEELTDEEVEILLEKYMTELGINADGQLSAEVDIHKIMNPVLKTEGVSGGKIRYTLPNGSSFTCNIPMGMITSYPVEFSLSQNITGVIVYNDEMESLPGAWYFQKPGTYQLKLISYQTSITDEEEYQVYEVSFPFTIINQTDGSLGAMPAPQGFIISDVWREGQKMEVEDERCFFFRQDGAYTFRFTDQKTGKIQKETSFKRDTKAPFLTFSKEIIDGTAAAPLEIIPSEPGCKVRVGYKGSYGYVTEYVLTAPGSYELEVEDSVGNVRIYQITLRQVFKIFDIRLIGAGLVLLVLMVGRLVLIRRDTRVL